MTLLQFQTDCIQASEIQRSRGLDKYPRLLVGTPEGPPSRNKDSTRVARANLRQTIPNEL